VRLDHSTKHIFIIPGIILAYLLRGVETDNLALSLILGFAAAVSLASANYIIDEWFDRETDRHHPYGPAGSGRLVFAQAETVGRERGAAHRSRRREREQARAGYGAAADDGERARAPPRVRQLRKGAALNAIQIAELLVGASLPSSSGLPA
jgi:hypothetical protein